MSSDIYVVVLVVVSVIIVADVVTADIFLVVRVGPSGK
jgi:hypothetical protein